MITNGKGCEAPHFTTDEAAIKLHWPHSSECTYFQGGTRLALHIADVLDRLASHSQIVYSVQDRDTLTVVAGRYRVVLVRGGAAVATDCRAVHSFSVLGFSNHFTSELMGRSEAINIRICRRWCFGDTARMELVGITMDVPVSNPAESEAFYTVVIGRVPDRGAASSLVEWIVHRAPEIAVRLAAGRAVDPARVRVGFAVADLELERRRLVGRLPDVPMISTRLGVIAELNLRDPDGYRVVLWQDLLSR